MYICVGAPNIHSWMNMNILIVLLIPIVSFMNTWLHGFPIHIIQWRHNERDDVLNHQPHHCLLNRLFRRRSKKISKLRVTGHCAGNSPITGEFPHKWPATRKMFLFDDAIMKNCLLLFTLQLMLPGARGCFSRVMNCVPRPECYNLCLNQVLLCPGRRKR